MREQFKSIQVADHTQCIPLKNNVHGSKKQYGVSDEDDGSSSRTTSTSTSLNKIDSSPYFPGGVCDYDIDSDDSGESQSKKDNEDIDNSKTSNMCTSSIMNNKLARFIEECCEKDSKYFVGTRQFATSLNNWSKDNDDHNSNIMEFNMHEIMTEMDRAGFHKKQIRIGIAKDGEPRKKLVSFIGIRIR